MNQNTNAESQPNGLNTLKPMMESAGAVNQVLTTTAKEMVALQFATGGAAFAEARASIVPAFAPGGTTYWFQQVPTVIQSQFQRLMQSMVDSVGMASRAQQQILELGRHSLQQLVGQSAETQPQWNPTMADRRVAVNVINFADRRAKAQAAQQNAKKPLTAARDKSNHRSQQRVA